ncbi:polysaccharide deacetylase family protein [Ilumatobacter nonamiensis]|uniref:polysaccharide deacetylase family protein n=1 Tax=Ilumatobacter nonamiensis TaxID=467093 RepID=UPI000348C097|nr:polysaccharide deacetylase family protein [Ilumatobacter nonamiensis]
MSRLRQTLERASLLVDRVVQPPPGVTILIYHRVGGGSDSAVDLPVEQFERQLDHLVEHHTVISLDDAVASLGSDDGWASSHRAAEDTPRISDERPPVVITVDDGSDDFAEHLVPAAVERNLPVTLYAATSFVDDGTDFPWGAAPATWSSLRDAHDTGLIQIESHTHTHRLLDHLPADDLNEELDRSIDLIGEHIGTAPKHFAYPKAVPGSPQAEVAVRRRFESACLARSRVNKPGSTDLHRLWRTPVKRSDSDEVFASKAAGGMRLDGELRALIARMRYRGETT